MSIEQQNENIIQIRNMSKSYGKVKVLQNISLDLKSGQIIGLLGPNGCGKTSLLKIIAGLINDYTGKVLINGLKPGAETKSFIAYLYSDEAIKTFAKAGAVQPVKGVAEKLDDDKKLYYDIYDKGAKPVMGQFAATNPVEGVSINTALFDTVNSVVSGDKTVDEWRARVKDASDKLRAAVK